MILRAGWLNTQCGDELLQVPKCDTNNSEYFTNMTNTCGNVDSKQTCNHWLTEHIRSMGHLDQTCNGFYPNMIAQEVSIIFRTENNNYATNAFLAFIHSNPASKLQGFHTILMNQFPNIWCSCPESITSPLQVSYAFKISHNSFLHGQANVSRLFIGPKMSKIAQMLI